MWFPSALITWTAKQKSDVALELLKREGKKKKEEKVSSPRLDVLARIKTRRRRKIAVGKTSVESCGSAAPLLLPRAPLPRAPPRSLLPCAIFPRLASSSSSACSCSTSCIAYQSVPHSFFFGAGSPLLLPTKSLSNPSQSRVAGQESVPNPSSLPIPS
jgi:hypothetical protein